MVLCKEIICLFGRLLQSELGQQYSLQRSSPNFHINETYIFLERIIIKMKGGLHMLHFRKIFILIFSMIIIAGCSVGDRQKIQVEKLSDNGNYENLMEITITKKVSTAKKILHNAKWEKTKVDMEREADYRFSFQFMNPKIQSKAVSYSVWVSPNKDSLELTQEDNYYVHLNKDESAKLFEVITGTNLSDQK